MQQCQNRQKHNCVPWRLLIVFSLLSLVLWMLRIIRPVPDLLPYFYGGVTILYPLAAALLCFQDMSWGRVHAGARGQGGHLAPAQRSGRSYGQHETPAPVRGLRRCRSKPNLLPRAGAQVWHVPGRRRLSPALLGTGILCFTAGQIFRVSRQFFPHLSLPFPLCIHIASYGMYPCFICAILLLPTPGSSTLARLRTLLDSLLIMATLTTLCMYFLLAPGLFEGHGMAVQHSAGGVSLVADLVLIFCLVLVALRAGEVTIRPVVCMLEAAVLLIFISNLSALSEVLAGVQPQMSPGALLRLPALFLLAGAARTLNRSQCRETCTLAEDREITAPLRGWQALCSPTPVLIASVLFIVFWKGLCLEAFPGQVTILFIGGFLLLMLVVLRQLLAAYEVTILRSRLQARNHALHRLNRCLEQRATTDPLTGLPNHRDLVEQLNAAVATAQAMDASCALIFIDIDRLKMVNDRYGHAAGDQVLSQFGKLVQAGLPAQTCVGRWGGEKFMAILPHSEWSAALSVAEVIRSRVEQQPLTGKGELAVTCSLGVASYPQDASTRDGLLMSADQAMHAAKRLGGNQVRSAHEPLVLALGILEADPEPASEAANMLAVVDSLLLTLEIRDSYTSQHSRRVSALSFKLALMLGLGGAEAYVVGLGGLLHDLGKIAVRDDILLKGGYLTADERWRMAQHPVTGADIVARVPGLQTVAAIVRAHHERPDGSGYPYGLRGEEIPLGARIVAVADAYDALTTDRAYRMGCTSTEAVQELLRATGSQFDPQVVATLVRLFSISARPE
jgi:diguanylate cyclase (GGDEF)-like protein/putative nucleotidyltransferase with HDIG domain